MDQRNRLPELFSDRSLSDMNKIQELRFDGVIDAAMAKDGA